MEFQQREQLVLRTFFFMPYIMPTAVLGIIWAWLYNPAFGPLNQFPKLIGLGALARPWLGDFTFVLPAVGVVATWYFFGFCMAIFLTGMQRIGPWLFDAAQVDDASGRKTFFGITLPLLLPEIRVVLLLTVIASIKSFDLIFTMTRGGPADATLVPDIYMYQLGFQLNRVGDAAAVAIIGALLIVAVNYASPSSHCRGRSATNASADSASPTGRVASARRHRARRDKASRSCCDNGRRRRSWRACPSAV